MTNQTFEDRLLAELRQEVTLLAEDRPGVPRRRVLTARRGTVALAACAAAVAGVVALPGGGGSAAYAVERNADGTVRVEISEEFSWDVEDQEALAAELREFGWEITVDPSGSLPDCGDNSFRFIRGPIDVGPGSNFVLEDHSDRIVGLDVIESRFCRPVS